MDPASFASASASLLGITIQIIGSLYGDWDHSSRMLAERLIYELSQLRSLLQSLEVATLSITEAVIVPQELLVGFEDVKKHLITLGAKLLAQDPAQVFSFRDYELPWRSFNAPRSVQSTKLLSTSGETLDEIEQLKSAISKLRNSVGDAGFLRGDPATKPIVDPAGALWRDCADYATPHQSAREVRVDGTGLWFVRRRAFRHWLVGERSANTLFCPGNPGSGKTIIMSLAIDEVRRWQQDNASSETGLAYFYFNFTKPISIRSVALTLLHQLYLQSSGVVDLVTRLEAFAAKSESPPLQAIITAILACANRLPRSYVILDALDECSPDHLADLRTLLAALANSPVRLMASSRPHHAFDVFEESPRIDVAPPSEDIAIYCQATIARLIVLARHPKLYQEVVTALMRAAESDRMFLPIVLKAAEISHCENTRAIQALIRQPPRALSSIYDGIWARVLQQPPDLATLANKTFTWLHSAQRPLKTAELLDILKFEYGSESEPPASMIIDACQGLLTQRGETVTLAHFSIKEYLDTKMESPSDVARLCIRYLLSLHLEEVDSPKWIENLISHRPFVAYAARYWGVHAHDTTHKRPDVLPDVRNLSLRLLDDKKAVASLCHLVFAPPDWTHIKGAGDGLFKSSSLHLAAHFGLIWALELLIDFPENSRDELNRTPLHLAAANDFPDCVKLLLGPESGNAKDLYGRTAWHYASMSGNAETIQSLVDLYHDHVTEKHQVSLVESSLGADEEGRSPLEYAAVASDPEVFRRLLPMYAASTGDYKRKALRAALEAGKTRPISLLLSEGEPTKYEYLLEAVRSGFEEAVQILLDYGTELDSPDGEGDSAVLIATRNGRNKILQFLVWNGADLGKTGSDGQDALGCAVAAGNEEAVRILLRAGVRPDEAIIHQRSRPDEPVMLQESYVAYAASQGEVALVEMLLNAGADSKGVATAATRTGQLKVLQKLEALGLLPDPASEAGRQLVVVAEEAGSLSVLEVLQPRGIEVSPRPVYSVPYEESIIESEVGDLPPEYEGHEPPKPSQLKSSGKQAEGRPSTEKDKKIRKPKIAVGLAVPQAVPVKSGLTMEKTLSRANSVHVRQSGLTDETPFLLLSDPIPADTISLGSIVADFRNPLAAHAPSEGSMSALVGEDWDQSVQHNYQAKKQHESTSGFALEMLKSLLCSKSSSTEQSETSLASEEVRRLQLRNHERVLTRILTNAPVREEVLSMAKVKSRKELFIVVGLLEAKGLHTRMLKHSATNVGSPLMSIGTSASKESEMRHDGSSIFAVSYRVIKIKTRHIPGFSKKVDIFFDNYVQPKAFERLL